MGKIHVGVDMGGYAFNPSINQVSLSGFNPLFLEQILLITNVTAGIIIYDFSSSTNNGTISNNVITLDYNCSVMSSNDSLQIFISYAASTAAQRVMIDDNSEMKIMGVQSYLSQRERKQSNSDQVYELLTYDTNMEKIFGSEILVNNKRIKTENMDAPDTFVGSRMYALNREVICVLSGHSTGTVQLSGTWAGTITFYGTVDYTSWQTLVGSNINVATTAAATTTTSGIFIFPVGGLVAFKATFTTYTSGQCFATLGASYSFPRANVQTTYDTNTAQALYTYGTIRDSLSLPQPWSNNYTYNPGDSCFYIDRWYVCISQHTSATAGNTPTNTTYWTLDVRQLKSLVTSSHVSSPTDPRIRVEIDMDGYQYRLAETQQILTALQLQNDMIYQDYVLTCMQDGPNGKSMFMGQSGMGIYNFQELR